MSLTIVSLASFGKDVKRLYKKYRHIAEDLKELRKILENDPRSGIELGSHCYKIRLANTSIPTGKSGGFRVIYYYLDEDNHLYLMAIYSKSELGTINEERIIEILKDNNLL
jgi:mRNA-degrading endonuclease RelE of RelBE toxin-antitoxin system